MNWSIENIRDAVTLAAAAITVVGAPVAVAAWFAARHERKLAQTLETYRAVHALYDQMITQKFDEPRLLRCARDWDDSRMAQIYRQKTPNDRLWATYYTYAELCIGFVNAVLQARAEKTIGRRAYRKQWERLVRLVIAEHWPILDSFLREGDYVSEYIRDYLPSKDVPKGWIWAEQYAALSWIDV